MVPDMEIAVVVMDGVFDTGLSAVLDAFTLANALGATLRKRPFSVARVGVRRRIKTGQGLSLTLDPLLPRAPDLVIVPALAAKSLDGLMSTLETAQARDVGALLRHWNRERAQVAAACTATFLLAASGLLDGKMATTTWWLAPAFRARFPAVTVDESRMIVDAGRVVTAGAALAHVDLVLWLIRRKNPSLARLTERYLTFDRGRRQSAYFLPNQLAHSDPLVERFETWARAHLTGFSLGEAARAVGASERTLERHVGSVLGKSPLSFVQDLRVEAARRQLETTDRSIDEIAAGVGYQDGVTLRTLLRKRTGLGVRQLRQRGA
jgi:transcriptional regulator GlxA family with amidase domain